MCNQTQSPSSHTIHSNHRVASWLRARLWLLGGCLSLLWIGCSVHSPLDSQQDKLRKHTEFLFDYPKDGVFKTENFYDFPYPHDLRLTDKGRPDVAAMPAPKRTKQCSLPPSNNELVTTLLKSINPDTYISDLVKLASQQANGFSLNPGIYMRFTRPLHKASIPPPTATLTNDSPIFMLNIDTKSPKAGQRIPIRISPGYTSRYLPGPTLVIRPVEGFVLQPKTTYAVVVLTSARDNEGWPLNTHPLMQELASIPHFADPYKEKLRSHYGPLFAFLKRPEGGSIQADRIAAATVFTTGDPISEMQTLYEFIQNMPAPKKDPLKIECSNNRSTTPYVTCTGEFESPEFQKGESPFLGKETGTFEYKDGKPVYRMSPFRFTLTIPKRYLASGSITLRRLPIVMYAHGTGGSNRTFLNNGTALALAKRGIAGFGIDQAVHGTRAGSLQLDFLFFNALNLPAARDNVRQSALDYFWQVRFLNKLEVKHDNHTITFDPKRTWFMGHSQGGLVGPVFLAFERNVNAAFLSAPGGFLIHTLLYKVEPKDPIQILSIMRYLLCDEDQATNVFHPILALFQNFFDPADPVTYSPKVLDPKLRPLHLLMTEGLTDGYAPPQVFEPLAVAMGMPMLGTQHQPILGLQLQNTPQYQLPVRGNYVYPDGTRTTVGFTQHKECKYNSGKDCDGHFVAFNNPNAIRNWQSFFQSLLYDDIAQIH